MKEKRSSSEGRYVPGGLMRCAALGIAATMITNPAQAAFHLWTIREIYTDASGSLQFIEMFDSSSFENSVGGMQITVTPTGGGTPHTFTVPNNLSGETANHSLLFATTGADANGAPTPDFVIPSGFLFAGGGMISFFGANPGNYTALPTDGVQSRNFQTGANNGVNSPQNFAGQAGTVVVPEPATWALLGLGGLGLCLLLRRRTA